MSSNFLISPSSLFLLCLAVTLTLPSNRLILIAEKTTVYEKFPTPLINRLEKHFVLTSSVLEEWQSEVLGWLQEWVEKFSHVSSSDSRFESGRGKEREGGRGRREMATVKRGE